MLHVSRRRGSSQRLSRCQWHSQPIYPASDTCIVPTWTCKVLQTKTRACTVEICLKLILQEADSLREKVRSPRLVPASNLRSSPYCDESVVRLLSTWFFYCCDWQYNYFDEQYISYPCFTLTAFCFYWWLLHHPNLKVPPDSLADWARLALLDKLLSNHHTFRTSGPILRWVLPIHLLEKLAANDHYDNCWKTEPH